MSTYNLPEYLFIALVALITLNVYQINKSTAKLTDAIVNQHICHVTGNPEEMIKLALKGRCTK